MIARKSIVSNRCFSSLRLVVLYMFMHFKTELKLLLKKSPLIFSGRVEKGQWHEIG